jgi:hypothetical protein
LDDRRALGAVVQLQTTQSTPTPGHLTASVSGGSRSRARSLDPALMPRADWVACSSRRTARAPSRAPQAATGFGVMPPRRQALLLKSRRRAVDVPLSVVAGTASRWGGALTVKGAPWTAAALVACHRSLERAWGPVNGDANTSTRLVFAGAAVRAAPSAALHARAGALLLAGTIAALNGVGIARSRASRATG